MKGKESSEIVNLGQGWETAIEDAKRRLVMTKKQAARLRNAIRIFQANKEARVAWPGDAGNGLAAPH
jgi:hypothetical protein